MPELKPCPFCGGAAELFSMKRDARKRYGVYHTIATIKCTRCTAQISQAGSTGEAAIEYAVGRWNRRSEEAAT